jgi:hypothetical protein
MPGNGHSVEIPCSTGNEVHSPLCFARDLMPQAPDDADLAKSPFAECLSSVFHKLFNFYGAFLAKDVNFCMPA